MKWANYLTVLICVFSCNAYSQTQDDTSKEIGKDNVSSYFLSKNNISIYPIPAIDDITIEFSNENSDYEIIKLVNAVGDKLYQRLLNEIEYQLVINVSDYEPGVYFLHFENSNGDFLSKKIIVK